MEGQFAIKRVCVLDSDTTVTEYFQHNNDGEWEWRSEVTASSKFFYGMAKLTANLLLNADKARLSVLDVPCYSVIRVDYYEEFIR